MGPASGGGDEPAEITTLTYERALDELDTLIARLEAGRVDLDEAINCYERGTRLAQHCERLLDRTEQKVTQVVVAGGGEREQPFEPLPPAAAEPAAPVMPRAGGAPPSAARPTEREEPGPPRARSVGTASLPFAPGREAHPQGPVVDPDDIPF